LGPTHPAAKGCRMGRAIRYYTTSSYPVGDSATLYSLIAHPSVALRLLGFDFAVYRYYR